jgi:hypothetical protein
MLRRPWFNVYRSGDEVRVAGDTYNVRETIKAIAKHYGTYARWDPRIQIWVIPVAELNDDDIQSMVEKLEKLGSTVGD